MSLTEANHLAQSGQSAHAVALYDLYLSANPSDVAAWNNRGNALRALGRLNEAIDSHSQALAIDPEFANAQWNQSLCRLLIGDYTQGWQQYEWRWTAASIANQKCLRPLLIFMRRPCYRPYGAFVCRA
jgi:tetratricopeptide (TPR) repeat protein